MPVLLPFVWVTVVWAVVPLAPVHPLNVWALLVAAPIVAPVPLSFPVIFTVLLGLFNVNVAVPTLYDVGFVTPVANFPPFKLYVIV